MMDSRALFYKQLYETLKGEFQNRGIKASAFHNRRLTQIRNRRWNHELHKLHELFWDGAQSLRSKQGGERPACQQTKGMSALGRMAGRPNKQNKPDKQNKRNKPREVNAASQGKPKGGMMNHKKLFSLIAVGLLMFGFATTANAWWDANWSDRIEMTIDNTANSNTLTNYQIRLLVPWLAGMQANFGDLRFIDTDDTTPLDYWIESYTASLECVAWVEIPSLPGSATKTVWAYYGNAGASSESNGPNTFAFFDNFDDGDISDWSVLCRSHRSGYSCGSCWSPTTDNSIYISSPYSLHLHARANCYSWPYCGRVSIVSKTISLSDGMYKLDFYEKAYGGQWGYCLSGGGGSAGYNAAYYNRYTGDVSGRPTMIYYIGDVRCTYPGPTRCGRCSTDWESASSDAFTATGGSETILLATHAGDCREDWGWWDDVRVRKYASPEPRGGIAGPADIIVMIVEPPSYIQGGETYIPIAYVRNMGGEPAANIAVFCSIWTLGAPVYHDTKTIVSLSAWGAGDTVEFDPWDCDGGCGQTFPIRMSSDFADAHPENNFDDDTLLVTEEIVADWTFEPTDDGFTHTTYRCDLDCWEWGAPSCAGYCYGGHPGTPPTPPYCWGTVINGPAPLWYANAGSRLLSPIVDLPHATKKLRLIFKHWWYFYYRYNGGNVKLSKDGGDFELVNPVGGYPNTVGWGCLSGERAYTYYGSGGWKDAIFDVSLGGSVNQVQFAWDYGNYYNYYCWGWAVDNVRLIIRYPPLGITEIAGIPTLAGVNCEYTPTVKVKNLTGKRPLYDIVVYRVIGIDGEPTPEYKSYATIDELAKDAEIEVTFDPFLIPPVANVFYYDSVFAGPGGVFVDTLVRYFQVRVDVGEHEPIHPMDSIFIRTGYYPLVKVNCLIGCDIPTRAVLIMRDSVANVLYISESDAILTEGMTQEVAFESVSVDVPGYYTFVLGTHTEGDSLWVNDSLRWDVKAVEAGDLDVGTNAIDMPDKAEPGDELFPEATVENYGQVATSFEVECKIEPGDYVDTKTVTGLEAGTTRDVDFKAWTPEDVGEYTVTVTTKLDDTNPDNNTKTHKINVAGIAEELVPGKFELSCIRPNPFSLNTEISYQLPHSSEISLAIYDISGKLVKTLVTGTKDVGSYTAVWDGRDSSNKNVPAGIYFIKLLTPEYKATRKVVLLTR